MKHLFPSLDDDAPLWVWMSDRVLSAVEQDRIVERLAAFRASWSSHGRPVNSDVALMESRLLLIAGDVDAGDISGCGIDKSVHVIERTAEELGFTWLDGMTVAYRRPGSMTIETISRGGFKALAESGKLEPETLVYDRSPTTLGNGRTEGLVRPASDTWTACYFDKALPTAKQP